MPTLQKTPLPTKPVPASKPFNYPFLPHKTVEPYAEPRYLIVTADDYCCAKCIDAGSLMGVRHGIVNTLTAITTYQDSAAIIRATKAAYPQVHIGVHLNITTGYPCSPKAQVGSLLSSDGQFHTIDKIMARLKKISLLELETELRAQIQTFLASGVPLDHLSYQHNLIAMYSPFFDVLLKLAAEYNVPVRNPIPISATDKKTYGKPGTQVIGKQLATRLAVRHPFKALGIWKYTKLATMTAHVAQLDERGIKHPDYLIDCIYGNPSAQNILHILNNLPPGVSELVFHLGINCDPAELGKGVDKHYLPIREQETLIATSNYLQSYLKEKNIQLVSFSDL